MPPRSPSRHASPLRHASAAACVGVSLSHSRAELGEAALGGVATSATAQRWPRLRAGAPCGLRPVPPAALASATAAGSRGRDSQRRPMPPIEDLFPKEWQRRCAFAAPHMLPLCIVSQQYTQRLKSLSICLSALSACLVCLPVHLRALLTSAGNQRLSWLAGGSMAPKGGLLAGRRVADQVPCAVSWTRQRPSCRQSTRVASGRQSPCGSHACRANQGTPGAPHPRSRPSIIICSPRPGVKADSIHLSSRCCVTAT
jgi:hypothetical protein